jgi:hypothetical protein
METNDSTFSAAKLREYVTDELKENNDLYGHTGLVDPDSKAQEMLSFLEGIYQNPDDLPPDLQDTRAAAVLRRTAASEHVGSHVEDVPAFAVGITDKEVEISPAKAFSKISNSMLNDGVAYSAVFFGNPNTGKSSMALLWAELWKELAPMKYATDLEPVVITNAGTLGLADHVAQSIDEFRSLVFGSDEWFESNGDHGEPPTIDPNRPKFWLFDECSTHLDARTNSYEVASQYTPLLKRFAKVNCDAAHIGHSGYDIHAELRRPTLTTEFIFKTGKKTAEVYRDMHEDVGADLKYKAEGIPDATHDLDPDDMAPWSWE